MAYSQLAAKFLENRGVSVGRIFTGVQIMPNECLVRGENPPRPAEFVGKTVILYLGYLWKRKGVDYLIEAVKSIHDRRAVLLIAGSGPEENRLRQLADGSDNIRFLGYADKSKKAWLYEIADIFVLPTLHDAWGLVINEAMFYGLPVITTTAAGGSDIVSDNGIIVPAGNVNALRDALLLLIRDQTLRLRMGNRSRVMSGSLDLDVGVSALYQAVDCVVSRGK